MTCFNIFSTICRVDGWVLFGRRAFRSLSLFRNLIDIINGNVEMNDLFILYFVKASPALRGDFIFHAGCSRLAAKCKGVSHIWAIYIACCGRLIILLFSSGPFLYREGRLNLYRFKF